MNKWNKCTSNFSNANECGEQHYNYLTGWICPKCGRIYGPFIDQCFYCNSYNYTITCVYEQ